MAKATKALFAPGPRSHEVIKVRECERVEITLEQFDDFTSTNILVRSVQDRVIWRVHHELGMKRDEIDTWLQCAPKRVEGALKQEPPVPYVGVRVTTAVQTDAQRKEKVETVITAAAKCMHFNVNQLRTRIGLPYWQAVIGSILLVLEYRGVASFHVKDRFGFTDAEAQELLRSASEQLYDSASQLYIHTIDLSIELGIKFEDLQKACT